MTSRVAPTEEAALGARGWAAEPLTAGNVGGRSPRFRRDSCERYMSLTELLMYTMLWHDAVPPLGDVVASVAKNAPSIRMGERLAADRLRLIGWSSSREKPQARKCSNDHRSDCAPVSAMALISACVIGACPPGRASEMVRGTLGWSRRRALRHSPLVKT